MSTAEVSRPNFSGVWSVNFEKSTIRGEIPKQILVKIGHFEPAIVQRILVRLVDDRERNMTFTFDTSGTETRTEMAGGVGRTVAHWEGSVLVIESWLKIGERELHFRDYWSQSDDGSTLTMAHPDDDLAGQISILERASLHDARKFDL